MLKILNLIMILITFVLAMLLYKKLLAERTKDESLNEKESFELKLIYIIGACCIAYAWPVFIFGVLFMSAVYLI